MATLCYNLFGYFPAPFVFGTVADSDKTDPIGSMRVAMGTITYWSILAVIFLSAATMIKIYSDNRKPSALQDHDGLEYSEYSRMGK